VNILAVSCIHNDVENLMGFIDKVSLLEFDVILCPGDFTDYNFPRGFDRIDMVKLIIEEFGGLKRPMLAVPGTWDKDIIDLLDREKMSIHGKGKIVNGIGFYGFGGAKTPFNTPFEPDDDMIYNGLGKAYEEIKNAKIKIQLTHAPPARTKLDIIASGAHVGSEAVRKFIEEKQPAAAICSHIHESRGVDSIGNTKILNSGRFPEGYCGLISVSNNDVDMKIINLI